LIGERDLKDGTNKNPGRPEEVHSPGNKFLAPTKRQVSFWKCDVSPIGASEVTFRGSGGLQLVTEHLLMMTDYVSSTRHTTYRRCRASVMVNFFERPDTYLRSSPTGLGVIVDTYLPTGRARSL
jgi:hypothetical protein